MCSSYFFQQESENHVVLTNDDGSGADATETPSEQSESTEAKGMLIDTAFMM